jgi:glycosyltransferase involved in cell wall biosynthesis
MSEAGRRSSVTAIIPALDEAGNIGALVGEVFELKIPGAAISVLVVDNGSSDGTAEEALRSGARVVSETRRGYGYACAAGVAAAGEAEILVFLDGDFSASPGDLAAVLGPILAGEADLVQGSRVLGGIAPGAMPSHQRLGNRLAARLISLIFGVRLTDLGPYRAIRRDCLLALGMREMTYGWPTEMTVKAVKRSYRLLEVPVCFHPRRAGKSKVSGTLRGSLLAAWFILGVTLRIAVSQADKEKEKQG